MPHAGTLKVYLKACFPALVSFMENPAREVCVVKDDLKASVQDDVDIASKNGDASPCHNPLKVSRFGVSLAFVCGGTSL
jgi:hypothetical protein